MIQHKDTSWFSIVLAMWLVLILSFTGLFLLEYMIPFSRNIKWIENASQAFYESYSGVEEGILLIHSGSLWEDYTDSFTGVKDFKLDVTSSGSIIPIAWKWNSEFDSDWNRLSQDTPISLLVWRDDLDSGWNDRIRLSLRVPDFDRDGSPDNLNIADGTQDIILWQLSSDSSSISSRSGSLITESDINLWTINETSLWNISTLSEWVMLDGTDQNFNWFYNNNSTPCNDVNNDCVLKISVINPLISSNIWSNSIPYLEYQIHTDTVIPLAQSYVVSQWKSFWFTKTLEVSVQQQSTSSAFDFTVLQ